MRPFDRQLNANGNNISDGKKGYRNVMCSTSLSKLKDTVYIKHNNQI